MEVIVLDTETTGLKEPQACEIAYFSLDKDISFYRGFLSNVETNLFESYLHFSTCLENIFLQRFKPLKPMDIGASRVNGIYDKDLVNEPCLSTFKLPKTVKYIIGHNIAFDKRVLNWNKDDIQVSDDVKLICTKELAQLVITGQANNKLTTLISHLYPEQSEELLKTAHSALQDCKLSFLILLSVLDLLPNVTSFEQLANLCSQGKKSYEELDKAKPKVRVPVTKMPFGKYKGQLLVEIPSSSLRWYLENCDLQPDLKEAIEALV